MLKPPAVEPPAVVGIVAPASPVREEYLVKGIEELERLGFEPRVGKNLAERGRYTAGTVAQRVSDLEQMWDDPQVEAIVCARGGYGSMQMLPLLEPARFEKSPKVLVGASDVTALLAFLAARAGIVSFHGPMAAQELARGGYDEASFLGTIGSTAAPGRLEAPGIEILHEGEAEGTLLGGCLSIVASLVGTPFLPPFDGAILFLEDTLVKPYQIDRMLSQLRLSGRLEHVRGIVFGEMRDCEQHPDQGYTLQEMLRDWTSTLDVPVLYGFPSGHTLSPARTLPLGARARVDGGGLSLLEGAVR